MNSHNEVFRSVLIVSANEGHVRVDRDFLKRVRVFQTRALTSGADALAWLGKNKADLVLCDGTLDDMSGLDFARRLKADPALEGLPVLMLTTDNARESVLEAVRLGLTGYLVRPYSLTGFARHMELARRHALFLREEDRRQDKARAAMAVGDPDAAMRALSESVRDPGEAERHFQEGMEHLAAARFDPAIACFDRAVAVNDVHVEAYLGLAEAWRAKGDERKARACLTRAAAACARKRNFQEVRARFVEQLKKDRDGFNPFFALGNERLAGRDYVGAVGSFACAASLTPRRGDVYVELAKAYHFLRRKDLALKAVTKGLRLQKDNPAGQLLYKRFTGKDFGGLATMEEFQAERRQPRLPLFMRGALYLAGLASDMLRRAREERYA